MKAELARQHKPQAPKKVNGFEEVAGIWPSFNVVNKQGRAWESLNTNKAIFLFGLTLKAIHQRSKVSYRTIQYFIHAPSRVGVTSAARIVLATKILVAERILWVGEPLEFVFQRWHDCDPRNLPKNYLKAQNSGSRSLSRQKAPPVVDNQRLT